MDTKDRGMIKIAVGCGKRQYPGYIHIDGDTSFEHVVSDDVWLCEYDFDSVDTIYCCHLLNYFEFEEAVRLLQQWCDVLKVGGVLRLAVPDFEVISELYSSGKVRIEEISGPIMGNWQMGDEKISHKSIWDKRSLANALESVGFGLMKRYDWRDTDTASIDDHAQAYLPHMDKDNGALVSLNIEAIKK